MSKTKAPKGSSDKSSKKETKKPQLASVKEGRVTKPAQTPKAKSKEIAKTAAASHTVREESKKKSKKAPTPEPELESDSNSSASESEEDSDSSASSNEEEEVRPKTPAKANGLAKAAAKVASDSESSGSSSDSSDEDSEDDSENEAVAPKAPKANGVKPAAVHKPAAKDESESESEDESASGESDSSESESEAEKPALKAKVNGAGKAKKAVKAEASSEEDSSDDSAADSSSDSDDASSASESEKEEGPSKKRKAETVSEPIVKKTKTEDEGEGIKNLFVGSLSWNVDEEWLSREFEQFGTIVGCRIVTDRESGRSRGFGYVEYSTASAAKAAQTAMHEYVLDNRPLNVDFSAPRGDKGGPKERNDNRAKRFGDKQSVPSSTLFIGNVSFDATNDAVSEVFSPYGTITRVSLPTDRESGQLKGFGYVDFTSTDEAKSALEALNGTDIAGRSIRIDFATPRDNSGGDRGGFGGQRGGFGGRGDRRGGGFGGGFGGRGGRGGSRGGARGGRGGSTNRGGFGDFKGSKVTF